MGSAAYAREELIAELGAVLRGDRLEIGIEAANHASWSSHPCRSHPVFCCRTRGCAPGCESDLPGAPGSGLIARQRLCDANREPRSYPPRQNTDHISSSSTNCSADQRGETQQVGRPRHGGRRHEGCVCDPDR
jgi:hypothetical protein